MRGGPTVNFTLLLSFFFWLASLASIIQIYYYIITCIHTGNSIFNGQYGMVILSLYFLYPNNFPPLLFLSRTT